MADNNLNTSVTVSFVDEASGQIKKIGQAFKTCGTSAQNAGLALASTAQSFQLFNGVCGQIVKHVRSVSLALRTGEVSASSFRRSINLYGISISKLPAHFDRLTVAQRRNVNSFRSMMGHCKFVIKDEASSKIATIRQKLEDLNKVAQACIQTFANLNDVIHSTNSSVSSVSSQLSTTSGQIKSSLEQAASGANKLKGSLSGVKSGLQDIKTQAEKLSSLGQSFKSTGIKILGTTAAVSAGVSKIMKDYAEVEYSQAELKNVLTSDKSKSKKEQDAQRIASLDKFNSLAMKLATTLPGSVKDMNEMFTALRERGIAEKDILAGAGEATAKFATVMHLSFKDAAIKIADLKGALGVDAKELVQLADLISKTKSATGLTLDNLTEMMKYASAGLKSQNLTGLAKAKEIMALAALSKKGGASGSTAGTSTSNVLSIITDIEHVINKKSFQDRYGELLATKGIKLEFHDKNGNFMGFENMLAQFEKLNVFNNQLRNNIIGTLVDKRAARLIQGWVAAGGVKGYHNAQADIEKQTDLNDKIKNVMATLTQQWGLIDANFQNLIGSIGAAIERNFHLADLFSFISEYIAKAVDWINDHPKTVDYILQQLFKIFKVAVKVGSIFVVVGSVLTTIGGVVSTIAGLITAFTAMPAVATAIGAVKGSFLSFIGWVMMLGGVLYELWPFIKNIYKGIKAGIETAYDLIKPYFDMAWDDYKVTFMDLWNEIDHFFKHLRKIDIFTVFKYIYTALGTLAIVTIWVGSVIFRLLPALMKFANLITFVVVRLMNLAIAFVKALTRGAEGRQHFVDEVSRLPEDFKRIRKEFVDSHTYAFTNRHAEGYERPTFALPAEVKNLLKTVDKGTEILNKEKQEIVERNEREQKRKEAEAAKKAQGAKPQGGDKGKAASVGQGNKVVNNAMTEQKIDKSVTNNENNDITVHYTVNINPDGTTSLGTESLKGIKNDGILDALQSITDRYMRTAIGGNDNGNKPMPPGLLSETWLI